jgi:hypothetical protein
MLRTASDLTGYGIEASDGRIGSVADFLFDDRHWTTRWVLVDTGDWLPGRSILLPPHRLMGPDTQKRVLKVALTQVQVAASPDLSADPPVSRQQEELIYDYYGWAPYWQASGLGLGMTTPLAPPLYAAGAKPSPATAGDPALRSTGDVTGYAVHARDGALGHVQDFVLDDESWAIRYLVVDTRNWWPGKKVLVSPHWVTDIAWSERTVRFDATRERIKASPEFDATRLDRAYEERLHAHYDRPTYWF